MKKSSLIYLVLGILIAFGGLFLLRGKFTQTAEKTVAPTANMEELYQVQKADEELLKSGEGTPQEISRSLLRYTFQNLPATAELVDKYLESKDVDIRAAAIEASTSVDGPKYAKTVTAALDDSEEKLRIAALKALGRRPQASTVATLEAYLKKPHLSSREATYAKLSLIRVLPDEETKSVIIERMIAELPKDVTAKSEILTQLSRIRPAHPALVRALEQQAQK